MRTFRVTVRTAGQPTDLDIPATCTAHAAEQAAERFADQPCGITVIGEAR